MNFHNALIRSAGAAFLVIAATACGSSADEASPPPSSPPASDVVDAEPTVATTTEPAVATTSEPEIIDSVTADTVPLMTDDSVPVAEELRDGVPTEKGKTYAIIDPTSGTGFSFVSSIDGVYPYLMFNEAALSLDEAGSEGLFSLFAVDPMRTFIDPTIDFNSIPPDGFAAVTEPVASDYLAWVAALPGTTVGPVEETTVDGWPARSMTYEFGPSHNGEPCDDSSVAGCLFSTWNPAGSVSYYVPGDTGTMYEVVVDRSRTLIDVSSRPGAQEIFESMHFLLGDEG